MTMPSTDARDGPLTRKRRPYVRPAVDSSETLERAALACAPSEAADNFDPTCKDNNPPGAS